MLVRLSGVVLTVIKKIIISSSIVTKRLQSGLFVLTVIKKIIIIIIMKAFYIFHRLEIRQTLKETWK